jgi:DNA-binding MarR family transcriptional regulator
MRAHAYKYISSGASWKAELDMDHFLTLFDLIGVLARRRYQTAEQHFSTLGLNHTEARLLTLLHQENGAATQEALSGLLFVDRSNAGRALKALEQAGYVERRKDDADKRTNLVQLTAKGRKAVVKIAELKRQIARSFFGDLTEDEAGEVIVLLRKTFPGDENG